MFLAKIVPSLPIIWKLSIVRGALRHLGNYFGTCLGYWGKGMLVFMWGNMLGVLKHLGAIAWGKTAGEALLPLTSLC